MAALLYHGSLLNLSATTRVFTSFGASAGASATVEAIMEKVINPIQNNVSPEVSQAKSRKVQAPDVARDLAVPVETRKAASGDEVVLSKQAQQMQRLQQAVDASPDVRVLTVAQLYQQVQNGTYRIPEDVLADRILKAFGVG
jgi:flagellar biosynthesis anti-sigma factor FlgM